MQVELIPRNYKPTKRVRETVDERAEKLQKYAEFEQIRVTLGVENVDCICEIHLHTRGHDFHTKAATDDMLMSVDQAAASLEKQLRRFKSKVVAARRSHGKRKGMTSAAALEAALDAEGAIVDDNNEGS